MNNRGAVTLKSLLVVGLVFSGLVLGIFGFMGTLHDQYGQNEADYIQGVDEEAKKSLNKTLNITEGVEEKIRGQNVGSTNIIEQIFGGLYSALQSLVVDIPTIFVGMITTGVGVLQLPTWVQTMLVGVIGVVVTFVIMRIVLGSRRIE